MKNIVIYGGGWEQNMGNSFIQIGSKYSMEQATGANVHIVDGNPFPIPTSLLQQLKKVAHIDSGKTRWENAHKNEVMISDLADIDAIVISGVWMTARYLEEHMKDFQSLKERGIKLIMNGVGGTLYTQEEFDQVAKQLEQIAPAIVITRDDDAYNAYKDRVKNIHSGIDVGFFVGDAFANPLPMSKHTVYCFDRGPIPSQLEVKDENIVTHHAQKGFTHDSFTKGEMFFSEFADDYLNLYANAKTYSDRVHACVATLAFGGEAQLIDETPRAKLFDRVGAQSIQKQLTRLNKDVLESKKKDHLEILRSICS